MPVNEFPGNSQKAAYDKPKPAPEEEVVEPVVMGNVIRRKTPLSRRIFKMFFSGDSESISEFLIRDVVVPAIKATLSDVAGLVNDAVNQGIQKAVYGDSRPMNQYRSSSRIIIGNRSHTSYNDQYRTRPTSATSSMQPARQVPVGQRDTLDIGDVILEDRADANALVESLLETIQDYGSVSVARLYNLMKQTSTPNDHRWGWTDLSQIDIRRVQHGYLLLIPPPIDLGR